MLARDEPHVFLSLMKKSAGFKIVRPIRMLLILNGICTNIRLAAHAEPLPPSLFKPENRFAGICYTDELITAANTFVTAVYNNHGIPMRLHCSLLHSHCSKHRRVGRKPQIDRTCRHFLYYLQHAGHPPSRERLCRRCLCGTSCLCFSNSTRSLGLRQLNLPIYTCRYW